MEAERLELLQKEQVRKQILEEEELKKKEEQQRLESEAKLKQAADEQARLEKQKMIDEEEALKKIALKEEIIDRSKITCFNCEGTGKNKNGKPCKKCQQTGIIQSKFMVEILKVIQEEVNAYTPSTFSKLMDKQAKVEVHQDVHKGIKCFKCGMSPISGPRYRCFQCENVNLCEICERIPDSHASIHAMIKIRKPELDPFKNNQSIYFSSIQHPQPPVIQEMVKPLVEEQKIHTSIMESRMDQSIN